MRATGLNTSGPFMRGKHMDYFMAAVPPGGTDWPPLGIFIVGLVVGAVITRIFSRRR